jgi:hypothetical protein
MLETAKADEGNVPMIAWHISSLDIERGGWRRVSKPKIELCNNNFTWVINDTNVEMITYGT